LRARAKHKVDAIFHAAAVSDFAFGAIWRRSTSGALRRLRGGKLATRDGILLAELVPTPKVIACLRRWFPRAWLVGWKYEVDASRFRVLARARRQIVECATDACVANGPGYGQGFGLVLKDGQAIHLRSRPLLFSYLERAARSASRCRCSTP
jgi:phosphopantothenoylcysteine decarboxylase/phosphopantothenate--cysteine ligase